MKPYETEDVKVEITGAGKTKRWKLSCGDVWIEFDPFRHGTGIHVVNLGSEDVYSAYVDWPSRMRKRKGATAHRYFETIPSEEYVELIRPYVARLASEGMPLRTRTLQLTRNNAAEAVARIQKDLDYYTARVNALDKLLETK